MTETRFHLHLVSDSTGETVHSLARASLAQFEDAEAIEHIWSMVRTRAQIERVIAGIDANPGVVLYTLVNDILRQPLQECCRRLNVPAIPVLDPAINALGAYLGRAGAQSAGSAAHAESRIFSAHRRHDLRHDA
ncbi:MAG: kinase/pyrophosphorylase [Aliidongia sp.]